MVLSGTNRWAKAAACCVGANVMKLKKAVIIDALAPPAVPAHAIEPRRGMLYCIVVLRSAAGCIGARGTEFS
jgi:hypothetical protein